MGSPAHDTADLTRILVTGTVDARGHDSATSETGCGGSNSLDLGHGLGLASHSSSRSNCDSLNHSYGHDTAVGSPIVRVAVVGTVIRPVVVAVRSVG